MKLHHLLDDMLDSKSKVRILRLLFSYPDREFTEREMAKMIGMSPNTVNLALGDLRRSNVFEYRRIGRTHSYRCDPDSVLFPVFDGLFSQERQMREDMMTLLREGLEGVDICILYGSFAREEEEFDSDLDILIVTKDKERTKVMVEHLAEDISQRFSITLAPMTLTPDELEKKRQKGFIKKALAEGKVIVGTPIPS